MEPFEDVTVLDFTQVIAGPLCGRMLADLGAEVIKVEPPSGESSRGDLKGAYFASYNTSKKSVCINLKEPRGQEIIHQGVKQADVILENFRPGVMSKFDLDYDSVVQENEDIIYCSMSGYGQSGPYSDYPAYDPIIQAMSGLMSTIGYPDRPPVRMGTPVIDMGTASYAAFAIVTALRNRDRTGSGEYIDVSLYETAISWMSSWIANYVDTGEIPQREGRKGNDEFAPTAVCEARNGAIYLIAPTQDSFEHLCSTIDREDLLEDERFDSREARSHHHDELIEELESTFEDHDYLDLTETLSEEGVAVGPVRDVGEVVEDDPHIEAREMLVETDNLTTGSKTKITRLPFTFNNMETHTDSAPHLGANTVDVLEEWGVTSSNVSDLLNDGVVQSEKQPPQTSD